MKEQDELHNLRDCLKAELPVQFLWANVHSQKVLPKQVECEFDSSCNTCLTVHSWRLVYTFLSSERLNTFEHAIQGKVTANSIVNVKGWPLRVRNVCTRVHECKVKEVLHDESNSHSSCFDTTSTTTTTTTADSNNLTSENSKFFKKSFYWSNHPYLLK